MSVGSRLMADLIARQYEQDLPIYARGVLLDLGCGRVPFYASYVDLVSEIVCVDWANSIHTNPHLDLEHDLTRPLPFSDGHFDTVILSDVLEHIPVPEELCREIARVLVPGGNLIMNVPFYYPLHEEPHDYYRYTKHALRRLIDGAGMAVLSLRELGGAPEVWADLVAKQLVRVPVVGSAAAAGLQWLTGRFVRTSLGRRVSLATGRTFPLGYRVIAQKM